MSLFGQFEIDIDRWSTCECHPTVRFVQSLTINHITLTLTVFRETNMGMTILSGDLSQTPS